MEDGRLVHAAGGTVPFTALKDFSWDVVTARGFFMRVNRSMALLSCSSDWREVQLLHDSQVWKTIMSTLGTS